MKTSKRGQRKPRKNKVNNSPNCNCEKQDCPLGGHCLEENIIYEAKVQEEGSGNVAPMVYVGLCSTTFKERYRTHISSFNNFGLRKQSELAEFIWDLKNNGKSWNITWRKLCSERPYNTSTGRCNLCLREKLEISKLDPKFSINKKSELFKNCLHKWRFKLAAFDYEKEELKLKQYVKQAVDVSILISHDNEDLCHTDIQTSQSSQGQHDNFSNNSSANTGRYLTRGKAKKLNITLMEHE